VQGRFRERGGAGSTGNRLDLGSELNLTGESLKPSQLEREPEREVRYQWAK
jgi:hypothetical protein